MFSSCPLFMRYSCLARAVHIPRTVILRAPYRLQLRAMSSSPVAPPAKRLKPSVPDDATFAASLAVEQAPVEALFVPEQSAASTDAGPSAPKATIQPKTAKEPRKKRRQRFNLPEPYSPADVLSKDVTDFLGEEYVQEVVSKVEKGQEAWSAPEDLVPQTVINLRVGAFTVSGESLSAWPQEGQRKWAVLVPFAHPGDLIRAKIFKHDRLFSHADLIEIVEFSEEHRGGEGDRRKFPDQGCKYFGECGGCQLQPMPYNLQLAHKKRTVQLAYSRFSALKAEEMPEVKDTIPSPKQWAYRTKITPHFDPPPKWAQKIGAVPAPAAGVASEEDTMNAGQENSQGAQEATNVSEDSESRKWECRVGFDRKGMPGVLDIEECPIATPVLNARLTGERQRIKQTIMSYKKGATLLLRDSLPAPDPLPTESSPFDASMPVLADEQHVAITDHKAPVYEQVGSFLFSFAAGSFFQNNNSILIPLTEYVREAIFPTGSSGEPPVLKKPTHLVDAYCGSGLFGITLSPHFERVAGVEISQDSIMAAKRNAAMNGLLDKTTWLCGKAEEIFGGLPAAGFEGGKSCVVVDPPRKGCDTPFLKQLLDFKPLTIVYVSCNVHTQARDVGCFIREAETRGCKYIVESLRGFDLFPQTAHVESVAVLRLVE